MKKEERKTILKGRKKEERETQRILGKNDIEQMQKKRKE